MRGAVLQPREVQVSDSMGVQLVRCIAIAVVFAATAAGQNLPVAANPVASGSRPPDEVSRDAPPAEAFRVLPQAAPQGPEITPYLLYQTALACG